MDWGLIKAVEIPEGTVKRIAAGGTTLWEKASAPSYSYIDTIDPEAFPNYTGLKTITLDGTETWKSASGAVYTSNFSDVVKNQNREDIVGYCADYTLQQDVVVVGDMDADCFIFNGRKSTPTNGNISFKSDLTTEVATWTAWLAAHPLTILISTNSPDTSVWKPAKDENGVTGYWNGGSGFVPVHGEIPYYGENILTQDVIDNFYQAYLSQSGGNRYWKAATDSSRTVRLSVDPDCYYRAEWDSTDSSVVGTIFIFGYTNNGAPSTNNQIYDYVLGTPQDNQSEITKATKDYLVIQASGSLFPDDVEHLTVREMIGYAPPALMMGGNPNPE